MVINLLGKIREKLIWELKSHIGSLCVKINAVIHGLQ